MPWARGAYAASGLSPAEGHVIFGYAGIAVYDAVMAVRRKYEPFAIRTHAPRGASPEAAAVAAAQPIYEHYLPLQEATILDPAYDASLATIPAGKAKTDGVAVGLRVANALIALRADDGFRADVGCSRPPRPGAPRRLGPDRCHPAQRDLRRTGCSPFALESAAGFRPDGPPSLDSKRWAREYNEVKRVGSGDEHDAQGLADNGCHVLGGAAGPAGAPRPPWGHRGSTIWTSSRRPE